MLLPPDMTVLTFLLPVVCLLPHSPCRRGFMVRILLSVLQFRVNARYVQADPPFTGIGGRLSGWAGGCREAHFVGRDSCRHCSSSSCTAVCSSLTPPASPCCARRDSDTASRLNPLTLCPPSPLPLAPCPTQSWTSATAGARAAPCQRSQSPRSPRTGAARCWWRCRRCGGCSATA